MISMFEANYTGKLALAAVSQILCRSWGYERLQKSKDPLKACFENVNLAVWLTHLF